MQVGLGDHSMGQGATFFRLHHVVYCPSLGARLNPVFMHGLSQIACMVRPSIEQGIPLASPEQRQMVAPVEGPLAAPVRPPLGAAR